MRVEILVGTWNEFRRCYVMLRHGVALVRVARPPSHGEEVEVAIQLPDGSQVTYAGNVASVEPCEEGGFLLCASLLPLLPEGERTIARALSASHLVPAPTIEPSWRG